MKSQIANPVHFRRLRRRSMEQRVTDQLRELIVTGELAGGTRLVQRDLAQRIGVSQTPVGIGLSELARDGLVEVTETGRSLVRRLTREDLEEIYAARFGLEGLARARGRRRRSTRRLRRHARADARARAAREAARRRGLPPGALGLPRDLLRASGRTRLVDEVERLFWRAERYNRLVLSTAARFKRSVGYYRPSSTRARRATATPPSA
jgi:DNA-binding GntR family transcriptional regulator